MSKAEPTYGPILKLISKYIVAAKIKFEFDFHFIKLVGNKLNSRIFGMQYLPSSDQW